MKKFVTWMALSALVAGCGVQTPHTVSAVSPKAKAPVAAQPVKLADAPVDADASNLVPVAKAPVAQDPRTEALAMARAIAEHGPLVTDLESLDAIDETAGFGVQTTPEKTQMKADEAARQWAPDAKQLWLGWGYKTISWFGNSRHVYYSAQKKRMLTIDYGFWGNRRGQYETTGLIVQYAGKLISTFLQEPRDIYPVSGREAFNRARYHAYVNQTRGTIKVLMLNPYIVGPQWVFLDERNKPSVVVDANTGEVTSGGLIIELLGYLF